jgi:hypothetical protein
MQTEDNFIEVEVTIPDSYQNPIFRISNEEGWRDKNFKRKEFQKDVWLLGDKTVKTVKEWYYWDREEIIYLVAHAYYTPKTQIATNLNRTLSAVKHKLKDIKEHPDKYDWVLKEMP